MNIHRYAAKRHPVSGALHLLPFHLLDVAAVLAAAFDGHPALLERLAGRLGLPVDDARALLVSLLALHDVGKLGSFQRRLFPDAGGGVSPLGLSLSGYAAYEWKDHGHDKLGQALLRRVATERPELFPTGQVERLARGAFPSKALNRLFALTTGHHGRPPRVAEEASSHSGHHRSEDRAALADWIGHVITARHLSWPAALPTLERLAPVSYGLAGLFTLCDWLGSNERFPYRDEPMDLDLYWADHALPTARDLLAELRPAGLVPVRRPAAKPFAVLMANLDPTGPVSPTPMQAACEALFTGDAPVGPTLTIIEDGTGSGKTEAGDLAVHRIIARGDADGVFYGLPTMATADSAFARKEPVERQLLEGEVSVVLRHGRAHLNPRFDADGALAWFAPGKRALLADIGVGTVDTVLAGVLRARHNTIRLWGLDRKVLLVDEVHACDAYMLVLLCTLLRWHAANGGSAVLMSATLPGEVRGRLVEAFGTGAGWSDVAERVAAVDTATYPLLTLHSGGSPPVQLPVKASGGPSAAPVRLRPVHDAQEVAGQLAAWAAAGRCAVWYRNTVDDAQEAYDRVAPLLERDGGLPPILLHARFAYADRLAIEARLEATFGKHGNPALRRGQVVIATQAGEQSLDLDFDEMVADLAPIDSVLQRLGRRRRHRRDAWGRLTGGEDVRPPGPVPLLMPRGEPIAADWYARMFRGGAYVYPDHARLWVTATLLLDPDRWLGPRTPAGHIIPDRDARLAVELVYRRGDGLLSPAPEWPPVPKALHASHLKAGGTGLMQEEMSRLSALAFSTGLPDDWCNGVETPSGDDPPATRLGESETRVLLVEDDAGLRFLHDGDDPIELSSVRLRVAPNALPADEVIVQTSRVSLTRGDHRLARRLEQRKCLLLRKKDAGHLIAEASIQNGGKAIVSEFLYDRTRGFRRRPSVDDANSS